MGTTPSGPSPRPGQPVRGSRSGRPIMALLDLLGRRLTLRVLWELRDGAACTFRELQERCGGASSSTLNRRLGELDDAGLVTHADGYQLTDLGTELLTVLAPMQGWAEQWADQLG